MFSFQSRLLSRPLLLGGLHGWSKGTPRPAAPMTPAFKEAASGIVQGVEVRAAWRPRRFAGKLVGDLSVTRRLNGLEETGGSIEPESKGRGKSALRAGRRAHDPVQTARRKFPTIFDVAPASVPCHQSGKSSLHYAERQQCGLRTAISIFPTKWTYGGRVAANGKMRPTQRGTRLGWRADLPKTPRSFCSLNWPSTTSSCEARTPRKQVFGMATVRAYTDALKLTTKSI